MGRRGHGALALTGLRQLSCVRSSLRAAAAARPRWLRPHLRVLVTAAACRSNLAETLPSRFICTQKLKASALKVTEVVLQVSEPEEEGDAVLSAATRSIQQKTFMLSFKTCG